MVVHAEEGMGWYILKYIGRGSSLSTTVSGFKNQLMFQDVTG